MTAADVRISIVTSTLNCATSLAKTAASIRSQTHRAVQWIVADGGSSDGTLEVIERNADIVAHWSSEPDAGIYDAWNKACRHVEGEWVLFLGAGDTLTEPRTIERMAAELALLPPTTTIAYGNVVQSDGHRELYRYGKVDTRRWELHRPSLPAHQGVFQRACLVAGPAPFDAGYRIAADSKFLLLALRSGTPHYVDIDVCRMEPGGVSADARYALVVMREAIRLQRDLGYRIPRLRLMWFIVRARIKYLAYRLFGGRSLAAVANAKRFLAR